MSRVEDLTTSQIEQQQKNADNGRSRTRRALTSPGLIYPFLAIIALGIAWFGIAVVADDPVVLPTPGAVVYRLLEALSAGPGNLWPDMGASVLRVLLGWGAGIILGIPIGIVMASSYRLRSAFEPLIQGGRAIPPLAWTPLLIVWLGIGELPKIVLIFVATVPIVAIATTAGVLGVDQSRRKAAQTLGASRMFVVRKVIVPASLPEVLTSARITYGLSWSCLVAAELIASTEGIGYQILQASRYLDTATIFVGIVLIGVLAYAGDLGLRAIEARTIPWKGRS